MVVGEKEEEEHILERGRESGVRGDRGRQTMPKSVNLILATETRDRLRYS